MIKLHGKIIHAPAELIGNKILTVTTNARLPDALKRGKAFLGSESVSPGFDAQIIFESQANVSTGSTSSAVLANELGYLGEGDVIRLDFENRKAHTLFRASSEHNTLLLTERCNHYCLMCSQPPKDVDDSWLLTEAFEVISRIPTSTKNIGFSGGEPTLYGNSFIELIQFTKNQLPNTALDVLTNGRKFANIEFTKQFASIDHPDCYLGIPLYSEDPAIHDYVVQANCAYDETIRGILNLKRFQQKVEIRVVLHRHTVPRLHHLAEFICRNLTFVDHVALMGLEMMGFTRANLDDLWIDPYEYKDQLSVALGIFNAYGLRTSVYNHQLCVINKDAEQNYVKSISDWKNGYVAECDRCQRRHECGGFFASSIEHRFSRYMKAFQ